MATKLYCVRIYERPYAYTGAKAENPAEAEAIIVRSQWPAGDEDIARVEVLHVCACGNANELSATMCARVSERMCKEVSVSLPLTGDSHDDDIDDYPRIA
jgi:hypothetical protein